jgi:hypothetical protein
VERRSGCASGGDLDQRVDAPGARGAVGNDERLCRDPESELPGPAVLRLVSRDARASILAVHGLVVDQAVGRLTDEDRAVAVVVEDHAERLRPLVHGRLIAGELPGKPPRTGDAVTADGDLDLLVQHRLQVVVQGVVERQDPCGLALWRHRTDRGTEARWPERQHVARPGAELAAR